MDIVAFLRAAGGLATVLGLLAGGLWLARRFKLALPGMNGGLREARLHVVERLALDQRRSILLIRRDGHEHLLLVGPEAPLVIEAGIKVCVPEDERNATRQSFASMLRNTRRMTADA